MEGKPPQKQEPVRQEPRKDIPDEKKRELYLARTREIEERKRPTLSSDGKYEARVTSILPDPEHPELGLHQRYELVIKKTGRDEGSLTRFIHKLHHPFGLKQRVYNLGEESSERTIRLTRPEFIYEPPFPRVRLKLEYYDRNGYRKFSEETKEFDLP